MHSSSFCNFIVSRVVNVRITSLNSGCFVVFVMFSYFPFGVSGEQQGQQERGFFLPPPFFNRNWLFGLYFRQYFKQNLKCPQVYMGTLDLAARAVPAVNWIIQRERGRRRRRYKDRAIGNLHLYCITFTFVNYWFCTYVFDLCYWSFDFDRF